MQKVIQFNQKAWLKPYTDIIQFNQKAWLKPYTDMNTKLRTKAKYDFEKDFFTLMNNALFRKTMENVRKHRNYLVSEPNYHVIKSFLENLLAQEVKKAKVKMFKLVYLGFSVLEISKMPYILV